MSVILNYNFESDEKNYYNNLNKHFSQFFTNNFNFSSNLASNSYSKWSEITVNESNGVMIGIANDSNSTSTNNILYSYNGGLTWSSSNITSNSSNTVNWTSIAFGNNKYVAVGYYVLNKNYVLIINESITTLTEIKNGTNGTQQNNWNSIIYSAGIFIAVAESGASRLMYSSDGENWNLKIIPLRTWKKIYYGKGILHIISTDTDKKIMYSLDNGITWNTSIIDTYANTISDISITFCSKINKFIFCFYYSTDSKNYIYTSEDGINWSKSSEFSNSLGVVKSIVWSQELELIVISYYTSSNFLNFIFSRDGVNFFFQKTSLEFSNALTLSSMIWNPIFSNFILVNNSADSKSVLSTKILGRYNLVEKNKHYSVDYFTSFNYNNSNIKTSTQEYFNVYPVLNIKNENISYSISPSLPSGVSLNLYNGVISGAYDLSEYFPRTKFDITANDLINSQKIKTSIYLEFFIVSYPLTIFYYNNNLSVTTTLSDVDIFTYAPVIVGSPKITYLINSNPSSLNFSLNVNTGILTFTPKETGVFNLSITATNLNNSLTVTFSITVKNKVPGIFN